MKYESKIVSDSNRRRSTTLWRTTALATVLTAAAAMNSATAAEIDVGNPEVQTHWDNTVKESLMFRAVPASNALINNSGMGTNNQDDGDRNFDRGLASARTDWFSEFDVSYHHWGMRTSAEAWVDPMYLVKNANNSKATSNNVGIGHNEFTPTTQREMGLAVKLLDAFAFGEVPLGGDRNLTFRAGRHALQWGETLFYGMNGIAGGQQPLDIRKLQEAPNSPFKEVILPVNQISAQLQLNDMVSVAAYYQLEWQSNWFPAVGSYFSTGDFFGPGTQSFFFSSNTLVPGQIRNAKNNGQGGISLRISTEDVDYGLYAINYHDKSPQLYINANNTTAGSGGTYDWVYAQNIQSYGASASTTIENVQVATEVSMRHNMDLASDPSTAIKAFGGSNAACDNDRNPCYATGNTLHANISTLTTVPPNFLAKESSVTAEIAANRVYGFTNNSQSHFATFADRNAFGWRMVYTPTYRQIAPNLDLSFPVGWGFSPLGKSGAVGPSFGVSHGGDVSFGVTGAYKDVWQFGLNYTHFYGQKQPGTDSNGAFTFAQSFYDRDFVLLNLHRTF